MDLELVASFLTLVDEGHFGRAAARHHLTCSALTKRIQRLERDLGMPLIDRPVTDMVTLTVGGKQFAAGAADLLAHAEMVRAAAREAARTGTFGGRPLRLGFPAGTGEAMRRHLGLPGIAQQVRANFPGVLLRTLAVPFSALASCLPDRTVDVLFANGVVRHPGVESFPTPLTSARVVVVGERHPLADAAAVHVRDFVDYPIGYNPAVAGEFMGGLWLDDLRPRRDARLVDIPADDQGTNLRLLKAGDAAMVTYPDIAYPLGRRLRLVRLSGPVPQAGRADR
ncbi:LysR family transcriptional regulator [Actinoplanes sp. NPDC051470]|uniref:LysR family transcriptional regulator n=1 Tax=Actinoplanes sp. NPDC051470 TaxID=3157224 RepID=UPI00341C9241